MPNPELCDGKGTPVPRRHGNWSGEGGEKHPCPCLHAGVSSTQGRERMTLIHAENLLYKLAVGEPWPRGEPSDTLGLTLDSR